MTQVEFSRLLGVHPVTVSKWERAAAMPSPWQSNIMAALAAAPREDREQVRHVMHQQGEAAALALGLRHLL